MGSESQTRRLQRYLHFCGNAQVASVEVSFNGEPLRYVEVSASPRYGV